MESLALGLAEIQLVDLVASVQACNDLAAA